MATLVGQRPAQAVVQAGGQAAALGAPVAALAGGQAVVPVDDPAALAGSVAVGSVAAGSAVVVGAAALPSLRRAQSVKRFIQLGQ